MSEFDNAANEVALAVTTQIFRLIRSGQMHDVASLLAQGTLAQAAQSLGEYATNAGGFIVVMFADETVFVNGQPVRATRSVYENILDVGKHLARRGFNELTIRSSVRGPDLGALLNALKGQHTGALPSSVSLNDVDPAKLMGDDADQSLVEQVAAVYGAATVLVRRCNDGLLKDDRRLMRHVKRVAQRLVTLTRTGFVELLALARRPVPPTDHAAISVNAAVIGAIAGRALTEDVHTQLRITLAALQTEIGKPRVAGMYRSDGFHTNFVPQLNQQMRRRLPASTAVMLLEAGRAAEQPVMRAVVAYETAHLTDGALLGWPYEGKVPPTVEAVIASLATRVAFGISNAADPDDLARMLAEQEIGKIERAGLDLVYSVLGLVPAGTPVTLTNGWRGVVTSAGPDFANLERPTIVLLLDSERRPVEPRVVQASEQVGFVREVLTTTDALLSRRYEEWVKTRDDDALPSTTGVLEPHVGDSLHDRASLVDFDADAATSVLDKNLVASFVSKPWAPAQPSVPSPPAPAPPPAVDADLARFAPQRESSAPRKFATALDVPEQPAPAPAPAIPKQFQQPPAASSVPTLPKQFQPQEPSSSVPKQFQAPAKSDAPAGEGNKVAGAWIRPATGGGGVAPPVAKDDPRPVDEPKQRDDSSDDDDDGDFDPLANIILLD